MTRRNILKTTILSMAGLSALAKLSEDLSEQDQMMPALFVGHGSPMNAIENNEFSEYWRNLGTKIRKPKAVICVSAHWLTKGTKITAMAKPKTIHDFGGFPQALFNVEYPASGNADLAAETKTIIKNTTVNLDHDWGLDHGTWSILNHIYPKADIPVLQLSIDFYQEPIFHFELGKQLAELRKKGVLIIGSGNMIHNLGMMNFPKESGANKGDFNQRFGYDWAIEINEILKTQIKDRNFMSLVDYKNLHKDIKLAVPSPDHYYPLLYTLGMAGKNEKITIFNDKLVAGSLNMTSLQIG